jgi:chaperonin GroES
VQGKIYCCTGCAAGGPCCCDYSQYKSIAISGKTDTNQRTKAYPNFTTRKEEHIMATAPAAVAIKPIGNYVVLKPKAKEETTKSGIVIPDTAKEKSQEGIIVAIGSGRLLDNGTRTSFEVQVNQNVLYKKYAGTEFKLEGEEYLVLKEDDILAIIG